MKDLLLNSKKIENIMILKKKKSRKNHPKKSRKKVDVKRIK